MAAFIFGIFLKAVFQGLLILNFQIIIMAVIALDLGGTKLAAALVSDDGRILFTETRLLEKRKGDEGGQLIVDQANPLVKRPGRKMCPWPH
jgi:hypothetical protein